MTREQFLELNMLHIHSALCGEIDRRLNQGGLQCGVPRLGQLPQSTLLEWERDIRHAIETTEEYWGKVEGGELEEWLGSRGFAISQDEADILERLDKLRKHEHELRMRVFKLEKAWKLARTQEVTND